MNKDQKESAEKNLHVENLSKKIEDFISSEDKPDLLIIKSHLICEYYLNQILIARGLCKNGDIDSLTFFNKLQKALDKENDYEKETFNVVNRLNKVRNKVGHELEYQLSESDLDRIGFSLGKEYIVEKYDIEDKINLLKYCLRSIIIKISVIVDLDVSHLKKELRENL